ncbi:MAG: acetylglutamate kinase [Chloroflexi bacterium]|nr:MAG: acetylglutamate kinase [Chloroflexota bacterium]
MGLRPLRGIRAHQRRVHDVSDVVVLKIGGAVLGEEAGALDVVGALHDSGHSLVVVHGGGPLATEWSGRLGLETRFVRGLRVTDAPTRDVALATLTGLTNTRLVAALVARGVPAVGLSGVDGGMLRAEREDAELGLVGRVTLVDSGLLEELLDAGRVPVVAPAALDKKDGEILNVNGDGAAGALAASLGARLLVFVTDVPGVRSKDGKVIASLDTARAKTLVDDGTIEGGMVPKVEACLLAASAGCRAAIVAARGADAIEKLLTGEQVGTVFEAAA